jgi:hypothetical protein
VSNPDNVYGTIFPTEPDMRKEMRNTIHGSYPEIAKGTYGLHRKMRKDSQGQLEKCPCVDPVTKEPDKDNFCPICYGEGYLWDENFIRFYWVRFVGDSIVPIDKQTKPGTMDVPSNTFYLEYNSTIETQDKLIEIDLDSEGKIVQPIKRINIWRPEEIIRFRADTGKLEFIKVITLKEYARWLNAPGVI